MTGPDLTAPLDVAASLRTEEAIAAFLVAVAQAGETEEMIRALQIAAQARQRQVSPWNLQSIAV
jgi:DNA-binding phage protein